MKNSLFIGAIIATLAMTTYMSSIVSAKEFRRVELTCISLTGEDYHFVLGEIDPTTNFLVKELRMAGSRPYVLLVNPEDAYETREFVWSAGFQCLLERHVMITTIYWLFLITVWIYWFGWAMRYPIFQRIKKGYMGWDLKESKK